jgi:uncharacterized protein with HEPN domain
VSSRNQDHLEHVAHAIDRVREWSSRGRDIFLSDELIQWAILRGLQTLTESATLLSPDVKGRHPDIDWKAIAGYRNIVVHGYLNTLSLEMTWAYVERDLPSLEAVIHAELGRLGD